MKFCGYCKEFYEDAVLKCPECNRSLSKPIRLAPKPGTPIVPRIFDKMSEEDIEDLKRRLLQSSEQTTKEAEA